jgi:hypothetical protein
MFCCLTPPQVSPEGEALKWLEDPIRPRARASPQPTRSHGVALADNAAASAAAAAAATAAAAVPSPPPPHTQVSPEGEVLEWLEDPIRPAGQGKPSAYKISSAHERNGKLWLGGLSSPFVSYIDLKSLPPKPAAVPESWSPPGQCVTPPCRYVTHFH